MALGSRRILTGFLEETGHHIQLRVRQHCHNRIAPDQVRVESLEVRRRHHATQPVPCRQMVLLVRPHLVGCRLSGCTYGV